MALLNRKGLLCQKINKSTLKLCRDYLPQPGQVSVKIPQGLRILLMSSAMNNLTHKVRFELEKYGVQCHTVQTDTAEKMADAAEKINPDIIVCPYLIHKIPKSVYNKQNRPCLIVHPGKVGDRGVNSLDFAIRDDVKKWGVTVLEAVEDYDAGDVWSTEEFLMPENPTKTSLYVGFIADTAVKCTIDAVSRFAQNVPPIALKEEGIASQNIRRMTNKDRVVDWEMTAVDIARYVRMSDTRPGAIGTLHVNNLPAAYRMFDSHLDDGQPFTAQLLQKGRPGDIVARRNGSILVKCGQDQGIWIGQLKEDTKLPSLKLPAEYMLYQNRPTNVPFVSETCNCDDIKVEIKDQIAFIHFDFYNGAMSTKQGERLLKTVNYIKTLADVKVVALMGGDRFFSTGINLNTIEGSPYKQLEAWSNINAINDVISSIVHMKDKVSVAVLQGNAGAGGVMFAAACDLVVSHPGVLLTPSYYAMNLHGSEYWTYFLPRRVGYEDVKRVMASPIPFSANKAQSIGLVDHVLGRDKTSFVEELPHFLQELRDNGKSLDIIREKRIFRCSDWSRLLETHRQYELQHMSNNFRSSEFLNAMSEFVYK